MLSPALSTLLGSVAVMPVSPEPSPVKAFAGLSNV
jgi:hypothetical protein